jgi:chromosome partitioning protein
MPVLVVANPKGGVGKSTLATNIAGLLARQGHRIMLGDIDRQQSSRSWLSLRPENATRILPWDVDGSTLRPPKGVTHMVLDTPAGLHNEKLKEVIRIADKIVVPLQPSMFDILATRDFLAELAERKPVRDGRTEVGVVGMRVDARTRAAEQLERFVGSLGLPVLGMLRDTQNYIQLAANGLTLFDVAPSRVQKDLDQWDALSAWLVDETPKTSPPAATPEAPAA